MLQNIDLFYLSPNGDCSVSVACHASIDTRNLLLLGVGCISFSASGFKKKLASVALSKFHSHLRVSKLLSLIFVQGQRFDALLELGNTVVIGIFQVQHPILREHSDLVAITFVE
mmetsp:Transcript_1908/g.3695  ORF Transcript_1908/g.3695 Transcript_1908/m.3695 type:complete len:114 (+) Transcript_1908:460-801(+)